MPTPLQSLFNPKTIAVVGVSADSTKLGTVILNNLVEGGFAGQLYAVNPKYSELNGRKVYPSVSGVRKRLDLVVIAVPAEYVEGVMEDCARAKTKSVIIISAGFKEGGNEGLKRERNVAKIASDAKIHLLGPNCLGVMVPGSHLNASFAGALPFQGNIAFVSQSGAVNTSILDLAAAQGLGFSHFVSLGNKAGLSEMEIIQEWMSDDNVKVIGAYIEQFSDGFDLVELARNNPHKPIVILHPGESTAAQTAMTSHTGSLAGDIETVHAGMRKAGVIQVSGIEKLFNTLKLLSWSENKRVGQRVAIVSNAGGPGIMLADMFSSTRVLQVAHLEEGTKDQLREFLPDTASVHNPVDIVGDARAQRYRDAISVLQKAEEVDAIITLLTPQFVTEVVKTAQTIVDLYDDSSKLIIPIFLGEKSTETGLDIFTQNKIAAYQFAEEAVAALGALVSRQRSLKRVESDFPPLPSPGKYTALLNRLSSSKLKPLPEDVIHKMTAEVGITAPVQALVRSAEEAKAFVKVAGYPVVLKATTADIIHKTDQKAVYLNIDNEHQLLQHLVELQQTIKNISQKEGAEVLLQQQIQVDNIELIIGANRDGGTDVYLESGKGFGHLLVFGKGGIYTNIDKDIATGLLPLSRPELKELMTAPQIFQIVEGVRGQKPYASAKLFQLLEAVQELILRYPQIKTIDINPVLLTRKEALAADIKIFVQK